MTARIDPRAARFGQGATALLALAAFVLDLAWVALLAALPLALGVLGGPRWNPWSRLFRLLERPLGIPPPARLKDAAPVRFANGVGAVFLVAAAAIVLLAAPLWLQWVGWGLVLVVASLALLAAAVDLCVGCEVYALLLRLRGRASAS